MRKNNGKRDQPQEIMTLHEVARLLRLHIMTTYKLVQTGKVPARKVGGQWRFSRQRLMEWIRKGGR